MRKKRDTSVSRREMRPSLAAAAGCGDCSRRRRLAIIDILRRLYSGSLPRDACRISTSGSGLQSSHACARVSADRMMNCVLYGGRLCCIRESASAPELSARQLARRRHADDYILMRRNLTSDLDSRQPSISADATNTAVQRIVHF